MNYMEETKKRMILALVVLTVLFGTGVAGYRLLEGWPLLDAVYMTVITLATVGYGETHALSPAGRVFTMFLILFGMGTFVFGVTTITALFVEGHLGGYLRRKKMRTKIDKLKDHYIVCGAGATGRYIIEELHKTERDFVVIENDPAALNRLKENENILFIEGDPAEDEILLAAGIKNAKGLASALPEDKDNLFMVVSARSLNPGLRIVAQATDAATTAKLIKAGADAVVSTEFIGGLRMASEMVRPTVVSFLDKMLRGKDAALRVEEVEIPVNSVLVDQTLREANITDRTGLAIIAVKNKKTGAYEHIPKSSYTITTDDILIVIGTPQQITEFKKL